MTDFVDAVVFVDFGVRGAERRDLDDLVAESHVRQVKAPADQAAVAEDAPNVFRVRVGRDVEILGLQAEQQVAHGAADQERLVTGIAQADRAPSGRSAKCWRAKCCVRRARRSSVAADPSGTSSSLGF